ncbi:2-isopropylmalate synthase [Planctomycetes bacterium Pla163]|uniref:2-isopropylmalate synthase n=1 Tax=Rohdeia mirabilis TaxID=2528008 RepID=A0A518CUP3_9BACT|nr:2-isopropylmalate synthase [Planctomycetes bacterium Pla163]
MTEVEREGLIHDWNDTQVEPPHGIEFDDETLRDGLQSPSANDPDLDQKLELLHLMDKIGITTADVGLPGAGDRARDHIERLVIETGKLKLFPNVACRTVIGDIRPTVDLAQRTGIAPVVYTFIGSSPIRMYAEDWDIARLVELSREAVTFAVENGLEVSMVTEDTTRANPEHLKAIYGAAIQAGATRVTLCDTCGHATPSGVRALMRFVKTEIIAKENPDVRIDWHGHRDRGLGLINTITAMDEGAQRLHATALGLGERAGNTEMDLLLINLKLAGLIDNDLTSLSKYCQLAHEACGVPFPENYPVFGKDAFETGTGVHAAAVIKAFKKDDTWLANRVYSGVPADLVGLCQSIKVGPMSGRSNVCWVLERHNVEATDERVARVLERAKVSPRLMSDDEVVEAAGA